MNSNKRIISVSLGCLLLLALPRANAQAIAGWSFENDPVAVNNSPAPSTGSGTADSIGMNLYATPNVGVTQDDVLVGASGDTGVNGVADLTNIWRIRGQAGTNGSANGWSSAAPIGTQGAQFFVPTTSVTTGALNVSFDWYATTQGEANLQLEYTTNGGSTWQNAALILGGSDAGLLLKTNSSSVNTVLGSYVSDTKPNANAGQDWFTGLTATINNPAALDDAGFGIELVNASTGADDISTQGTALNNTSGNWRFDNVTVSAAAVPEPSSWALGVVVALAFVGLRRRFARIAL